MRCNEGSSFFFFCFRFFLPSIVFTAVAFRWPCFVAFDCHSIFIYQRTRVLCELNVFQVSYVNPLSPCIITNPPLCSCFFFVHGVYWSWTGGVGGNISSDQRAFSSSFSCLSPQVVWRSLSSLHGLHNEENNYERRLITRLPCHQEEVKNSGGGGGLNEWSAYIISNIQQQQQQ